METLRDIQKEIERIEESSIEKIPINKKFNRFLKELCQEQLADFPESFDHVDEHILNEVRESYPKLFIKSRTLGIPADKRKYLLLREKVCDSLVKLVNLATVLEQKKRLLPVKKYETQSYRKKMV